jgi:unsaturated rhamnogalacturonyl hydrolase
MCHRLTRCIPALPALLLLAFSLACSGKSGDSSACKPLPAPVPRSFADETLARDVADAWMKRHKPESMEWDWGPAVLAYGMLDLYEATGDIRYRDYVDAWVKFKKNGHFLFWSDHVPPVASMLRIYRWTCNPDYKTESVRAWDYLTQEVPHTAGGGISHLGTFAPGAPQLWVDSLFMFGGFLLERARDGDMQAADLYAEQVKIFSGALQDPNGLFKHALIDETPTPPESVFWARGNSWIVSMVARYLDVAPKDLKQRADVEKIEGALIKAVIGLQDSSGLWWTVINRPGEIYLETSASALFADGIIRAGRLGVIPAEEAEQSYSKAMNAIRGKIVYKDGLATVTGTSVGTSPSGFSGYASVPQEDDVNYGVGSVLMALTAAR